MSNTLLIAGILAILLGLIHSLLGERLIFRRLGSTNPRSTVATSQTLPLRSIRILWASWHIVTVFGWGFAALLFKLATNPAASFINFTLVTIVVCMLVSAMLVLIGTKAKHPGWIVLLLIGILALSNATEVPLVDK